MISVMKKTRESRIGFRNGEDAWRFPLHGFTLIELLVVVAIIAVKAGHRVLTRTRGSRLIRAIRLTAGIGMTGQ